MKFSSNSDICIKCNTKNVYIFNNNSGRIGLRCKKRCFSYITRETFTCTNINIKDDYTCSIYIFFDSLERSVINYYKSTIRINTFIDERQIKYLSEEDIINKFLSYYENLIFL